MSTPTGEIPLIWNRKRRTNAQAIVDIAERHVGYRAQPNRQSVYQAREFNGRPWNGSFVDRVMITALDGTPEVRFYSTVTALSYYVRKNRLYRTPEVGTVVFYNFATDPASAFEQPHIGIVTEVKSNGVFTAIEGETSPGVPQGSQLTDGVFLRERHVTDTVGFVRVKARKVTATEEDSPVKVRMSYLTSNPQTKARAVANVQTALNRVTGKPFNRGKLDTETRSSFGAYSRERGLVENRGEMSYDALNVLATESGVLDIEP